jgi:hypothetical protein
MQPTLRGFLTPRLPAQAGGHFHAKSREDTMCEYDFLADLLNKFSQLTPWIQAVMVLSIPLTIGAMGYAFKKPCRRWPMEI